MKPEAFDACLKAAKLHLGVIQSAAKAHADVVKNSEVRRLLAEGERLIAEASAAASTAALTARKGKSKQ